MGALIRAFAWERGPLGPPAAWPQSLRTAIRMLLTTRHPVFLFWGPERICFYNDAYRASLGEEKHPGMLGARGAEAWAEIWPVIGPQIDQVLQGGAATWHENQLIPITRHGVLEDVWWTYSYGPVDDETAPNGVGGAIVLVTETTERVVSEQRLEFLLKLGDRLLEAQDAEEVLGFAVEALARRLGVAGVACAEVDPAGEHFDIRKSWSATGAAPLASRGRLDALGSDLMAALQTGEPVRVNDVGSDPRTVGVAPTLALPKPAALLVTPLVRRGRLAALLFAEETAPRRWSDADAQLLVDAGRRVWEALERARVEAQMERQRQAIEAANRRLTAESDFLRQLFEQAPGFMCVLQGPEHVFALANPPYLALVGSRDVVGRRLREALPEVANQGFVDLLDQVFATGEPYNGRGVRLLLAGQDGELRERVLDFVYQPVRAVDGRVAGIFVEGSDVTDSVVVAERLAIAQRAGQVGAFEWFPETGKVIASDEYRRIWGIDPETEIDAALLLSLVDQRDQGSTGPARLGQENPLEYAEYRIRRPDTGEVRWLARRGEVVEGAGLAGRRFIGVAFDITERKAVEDQLRELNDTLEQRVAEASDQRKLVEEALRQSQKMEAIGQLTGGIAHDFNNLLTGVIGSLDLVRRRLDAGRTDGVARFMDAATTSAQRAASLTHRLLAFARRQTLDPRPLDVNLLVESMAELLHRTLGEQIVLEVKLDPDAWRALSDAAQLESVVLNLAINARDAMPEGGVLTIATRNRVLDEETARRKNIPEGDYLALCVSDTGVGMSPEVMARAFEPFFTTKPIGRGTGLGLSMIYGFAKQSGGHVRIDSEPGEGTTVTVLLPRHAGPADADTPAERAAAPSGAGETVLVVEDDLQVRMLVLEVLKELGYRSLEAGDAEAALPLLKSRDPIELMVSDVGLPGVNGRQLAEMARQLRPGLKVLFITGYAENVAVRSGFLDAQMDMISKPFDLDQLAAKIREMIASA